MTRDKETRKKNAKTIDRGTKWAERLDAAGLLPDACFDIKIELPCDRAGGITFYCHLTDDVTTALGDSLGDKS